jgi:hypothetical protein
LSLFAANDNIKFFVPLRYSNNLCNFFQSSVSGSLTLVVKNAIVVCMSGLARLHKNKPLAVIV